MIELSLDEQLEALDDDCKWNVIETYKQTEHELTQKVVRATENDNISGTFIRKEFSPESKQGTAYEKVWEEQQKGRYLKSCPQIVDYYEYAQNRVVVLKYAEGETLEQYIRGNNLTDAEVKQLFLKICDAVNELHTTFEQPLIHRDLKPTNIIVKDGTVSIIDLGIARFQRGGITPDTTQFGTPAFAPPEQYGFGETSVESDIYALGMVLYFMLTGKLSATPLRNNATFKDEIPVEFQSSLLKATSFDPKDRFHCVHDLKRSLLKRHPASLARQLNKEKIRLILGKAWNFLLLVSWLFTIIAAIGCIVDPTAEQLTKTLEYRIVAYGGIIAIPFTIFYFVLLDKARLKERFPKLECLTWKKLALLVLLAVLIMVGSAILTNYL